MICPLTGRTATSASSPDQAPAASTTAGAWIRSPLRSSAPVTSPSVLLPDGSAARRVAGAPPPLATHAGAGRPASRRAAPPRRPAPRGPGRRPASGDQRSARSQRVRRGGSSGPAPARAGVPGSGAGGRSRGRAPPGRPSSRSSPAASSASRATISVPSERRRDCVPEASASSAANSGQRAADSRPSSSRRPAASPNPASAIGPSMPAATCDAPDPNSARSQSDYVEAGLGGAPGDREADRAASDHERHRLSPCSDADRTPRKRSTDGEDPAAATLRRVDPRERQAALAQARLYLICRVDQLDRAPLAEIDVLQLRDKHASPADLLAAARLAAERCVEHGVLFIVNDHPQLARESGADGVHLGQDDTAASVARMILGDGPLIGLSTHTPDQIDGAEGSTTSVSARYTRPRPNPADPRSGSASSAMPPPAPAFHSSRSAASTPAPSPPSGQPAPSGSRSSARSPTRPIRRRPRALSGMVGLASPSRKRRAPTPPEPEAAAAPPELASAADRPQTSRSELRSAARRAELVPSRPVSGPRR